VYVVKYAEVLFNALISIIELRMPDIKKEIQGHNNPHLQPDCNLCMR